MPISRKTAAWLVHLYTISGGVLGMLALLAVYYEDVALAFLLLALSMLIDATDGILARRVDVVEVLPGFSGAQVDNAVDVLTFVFVPIFIMATAELIPHPLWIVVPIVAALYAYGQVNMKTEDNFFLGFPSYWNVIALYMYWLEPSDLVAILMLAIPAIPTFIPTRYLYPSRNSVFWKTTWALGCVWFFMLLVLLLQDSPSRTLVLVSLYYPAYYFVASFYVDWRIRRDPDYLRNRKTA